MMEKINVLLVDDHVVVRAGIRMLLAADPVITIVGEAARCEEAGKLYDDLSPDVVVMDLSMPGLGGLECIRRLCARDTAAKILVFSMHDEQVYIERSLAAGAKGYISKNSAADRLLSAIKEVASGAFITESGFGESQAIASDRSILIASLTPKEFDVFRLLAKGLTTHEVAAELCLGVKTVANYNSSIKAKLQINTGAELARLAIEQKII